MPSPSPISARAIEVRLSPRPEYRVIGALLGTLASPPSTPDDRAWRDAFATFAHLAIINRAAFDSEWGSAPQPIYPADILPPSADLERRIKLGLREIDLALLAAHAMVPLVVAHEAASNRADLRRAPPAIRNPASQNEQINRVLGYGDEWREHLEGLGLDVSEAGLPKFGDSPAAVSNFKNRVLRPKRSVLHLAIGLSLALDVRSKGLAAEVGTQAAWELAGYATYTEGARDAARALPMISIENVLREPDIALMAILYGQRLEAASAAVRAKARPSKPPVHLRLA